MSLQQPISEPPADPEADDLAHNCCKDRDSDQEPNIDVMGSGGEKRGRNQSRLGGQRKPNAFERDECCDQPDPVDRDELSHFPRLPDREMDPDPRADALHLGPEASSPRLLDARMILLPGRA